MEMPRLVSAVSEFLVLWIGVRGKLEIRVHS